MFKFVVFIAIVASVFAVPAPEPKPAPKPGLISTSYSAPIISSAPLAYSAPLTYSSVGYSGYYLPSAYASGYAYSPYSSYIV
ncbi:neuropeptide-like 4 isoform X1 [Aethina tumida]|uniref:neuropeptide-like 4 isoform X1 n=1 Tax=Aethina tumida TaxID=116153 RepID=UPI00096B2FB3|nr:neuropeptide-like 4 isoform X1 [Aethina tumida]